MGLEIAGGWIENDQSLHREIITEDDLQIRQDTLDDFPRPRRQHPAMVSNIVTHPGGAHKDDLLAACVLVAKYGVPVQRRNVTAEDLDDPEVAVLDIGGRHEPERMNFDHHHFEREHPPTCSLSLVLQHYGIYEDALQFCEWLPTAEWFDSRGPKETAAWLGVPRKAIAQLHSPIDTTLLRRFAMSDTHSSGEPIYEYMRLVGEDLLSYLKQARDRLNYVAAHVQMWELTRGDKTMAIAFLPRTDTGPDEPSRAVASYVRAQGLHDQVSALIYPDRRGGGYGLARYEDCLDLDFSRVEGAPDVHFAHKRGFVCKTSATSEARLRELMIGAWV